jgi:hypothetical protein
MFLLRLPQAGEQQGNPNALQAPAGRRTTRKSKWVSTGFHGLPRASTVWFPRASTGFHEPPRASTGFHGLPRASAGFHGRFPRASTGFHGRFPRAPTGFHGRSPRASTGFRDSFPRQVPAGLHDKLPQHSEGMMFQPGEVSTLQYPHQQNK